jgi:hypothetical protein
MNITTANYFTSVQSLDWNAVPASLKKMHDTLIPEVSENDWKEYSSDADIKRTVDKYFGYITKYMPASSRAPVKPAKPVSLPKPKKPSAAKVPTPKIKPVVLTPVELPEPKQVVHITTATAFIKRYAALHGKVKTREQILSLTHGFQKAITEQRIRKDSPVLKEVERMQRELLTLLSSMTGNVKIEIDAAFLAHCRQIAQGEEVRTSVKLIKSFITMSGKAYDKVKASTLLKKMETAVGKIPAEDPYRSQLIAAMETLGRYCKGTHTTVGIPPAFLYGLGTVATVGYADGLGYVGSGDGSGAVIRLLRAEGVKDLSERTLKKAVRGTAAPGLCLELARMLIQRGDLSMAVLNTPPVKTSYREKGMGLAGIDEYNSGVSFGGISGLDVLEMQLDRSALSGSSVAPGNKLQAAKPATLNAQRPARPVQHSESASPDTISAKDLAKMTFQTIGYNGRFRNVVGDPEVGFRMMVFGKPFQGKSSFVIELCKDLAALKIGKITYLALEEGISMSMQKKVIDRGAANVEGLEFKGAIPASFDGYSFVVIDSVSDRGISREKLREMFLHNPDTCFICIFHATKTGAARGGLDFAHDMDIIIRIEEHQPFVEKNRFL